MDPCFNALLFGMSRFELNWVNGRGHGSRFLRIMFLGKAGMIINVIGMGVRRRNYFIESADRWRHARAKASSDLAIWFFRRQPDGSWKGRHCVWNTNE